MRGRTIVSFVILSLPAWGQHGSTNVVNPYTSKQDALSGAKLYRAQCAGCHGLEGSGTGTGPSLVSGSFRHGGSDEALFQSIVKGVPGTAMPPFSGFSGLQVWQLVTHIRSLAVARAPEQAKGDANAGAEIFRASCSGCHAIGGKGGLRGPDLAGIGLKRSGPELRAALVNPDAEVPSAYWTMTVQTDKGVVEGTRLNEDTHSVQLRDKRGTLISVLKRDVRSSEILRKSPMPSFQGKLTPEQIDNLIAWLTRQREEDR